MVLVRYSQGSLSPNTCCISIPDPKPNPESHQIQLVQTMQSPYSLILSSGCSGVDLPLIKILGREYLHLVSILAVLWVHLCPKCVCSWDSAANPLRKLTALFPDSLVGEGLAALPQEPHTYRPSTLILGVRNPCEWVYVNLPLDKFFGALPIKTHSGWCQCLGCHRDCVWLTAVSWV